MTRDDIIRMAREAGINEATAEFYCDELGRLIAAEREACAGLCEWKTGIRPVDAAIETCAAAIRARSEK